MKEKKKNFPSGLPIIKDFFVGQNHQRIPSKSKSPLNSSTSYLNPSGPPTILNEPFLPSGLPTIKDFLIGQDHQEGSTMGHHQTSQQVIFPSELHTKKTPLWVTNTLLSKSYSPVSLSSSLVDFSSKTSS